MTLKQIMKELRNNTAILGMDPTTLWNTRVVIPRDRIGYICKAAVPVIKAFGRDGELEISETLMMRLLEEHANVAYWLQGALYADLPLVDEAASADMLRWDVEEICIFEHPAYKYIRMLGNQGLSWEEIDELLGARSLTQLCKSLALCNMGEIGQEWFSTE